MASAEYILIASSKLAAQMGHGTTPVCPMFSSSQQQPLRISTVVSESDHLLTLFIAGVVEVMMWLAVYGTFTYEDGEFCEPTMPFVACPPGFRPIEDRATAANVVNQAAWLTVSRSSCKRHPNRLDQSNWPSQAACYVSCRGLSSYVRRNLERSSKPIHDALVSQLTFSFRFRCATSMHSCSAPWRIRMYFQLFRRSDVPFI